MIDCYNKESVKGMLRFYLSRPGFDSGRMDILFQKLDIADDSEESVEKYIRYDMSMLTKVSHKNFIKYLTFYRDKLGGSMDKRSMEVINKLIGDKKLFKKVRFCADNSYHNNAIFFRVKASATGYWKGCSFQCYDANSSMISGKKKVNQVFNNYDIIFCNFYTGTNAEIFNGIKEEMRLEQYAVSPR